MLDMLNMRRWLFLVEKYIRTIFRFSSSFEGKKNLLKEYGFYVVDKGKSFSVRVPGYEGPDVWIDFWLAPNHNEF